MKHAWSVICLRSIFDQQTNNVSLIDVLERIEFEASEKIDYIPVEFDLVSLWSRTDLNKPEKSKGQLEIVYATSGQKLHTREYELDLTEALRARGKGTFTRLPFAGSGVYNFVISLWDEGNETWQEVASVPLEINQRSLPTEE